MEVILTTKSITFKEPTKTLVFLGENLSGITVSSGNVNNTEFWTNIVLLGLDGKEVHKFDLRQPITGYSHWKNDPDGIQLAINTIAEILGVPNCCAGGGGGGTVDTIVAGTGISVDSTDPANPIVSATGGGGDVVGPASSTTGHVPQYANGTGKLLSTGLDTSLGGNGPSDSTKLAQFNANGGLLASVATAPAIQGTYTGGSATSAGVRGIATAGIGVDGSSTNSAAVRGVSINSDGVLGQSTSGYGVRAVNSSVTEPALHVNKTAIGPIAHFESGSAAGTELAITALGGLEWNLAGGDQETADNLPAFTGDTGTGGLKGVVPAPAAGDAAANKYLKADGTWATAGGGVPETVSRDINQVTHALAVGDVIRYNGTAFVKAQADAEANAECMGVVSAVADVDNFTMTTHGYVTGLSGLTSGVTYFLSETTAGLLTATPPTGTGEVRKAQFIATSTTTGHYNNFVGYILP